MPWHFGRCRTLGAGNAALRGRTRAVVNESTSRRARTVNQIRDEVASAYADVRAQLQAINVSQRRLATAEPGFVNELRRARAKQGLPIEVLNMVHLLVDARESLVRSVIEYDKAQFRLYVALGQPPDYRDSGQRPQGRAGDGQLSPNAKHLRGLAEQKQTTRIPFGAQANEFERFTRIDHCSGRLL